MQTLVLAVACVMAMGTTAVSYEYENVQFDRTRNANYDVRQHYMTTNRSESNFNMTQIHHRSGDSNQNRVGNQRGDNEQHDTACLVNDVAPEPRATFATSNHTFTSTSARMMLELVAIAQMENAIT